MKMPRVQRYGFPFQYYNPYNYKPRTPISKTTQPPVENFQTPLEKLSTSQNSNRHQKTQDPVWLDLFGIKLHFDDVLILSLLFFLYKEDVKDEGLFLALVLLLIT
jgi:hypothetical protein